MTLLAAPEPVAESDDPDLRLPELPIGRWLRDNPLFAAVVAVAVVLRLIVEIAYPPALEFFGDSYSYLFYAAHLGDVSLWHPLGYPFFIWLTSFTHSLLVLTLIQHALAVASAVLVYRLVRSTRVGGIGATVAALPLLLDGYQLDVEQFVLSDTLFTFLVVATVVACRRMLTQSTAGRAAAVGALLAAATLTRTVGLAVAVAIGAVLLLRRVPWSHFAAVAAMCGVPIGAYMLAFHATYGVYGLQAYSGRYLYGTVAPFARCDPSSLPEAQQPLCPTTPVATRPGSNEFVWGIYPYTSLPGDAVHRSQEAGQFAKHIALSQPVDFATAVASNVAHYFSPRHDVGPRDWFVGSWQFPTHATSPAWNIQPATEGIGGRHEHGHINAGLASLLRGYQRFVFVPGLALLLAAVVAAAACLLRRREGEERLLTGLLVGTGLLLLVVPSMSAGFDWRYVLPAQALIVPAGVMGWRRCVDAIGSARARRVAPLAAATAVLALAAPTLASPSMYEPSALAPHRVLAAPSTQHVGGLDLHLGIPDLIGVRCRWDGNAPRLDGIVATPLMFSYRVGEASLVQPGNFAVNTGSVTSAPAPQVRNPGVPSTMIGPQSPSTTGVLYLYVRRTTGIIRYVDPVGRGAAAWRYHVSSPPEQKLGALCTGSSPWAGAQVHSLRISGLPTFTLGSTQPVNFGFAHRYRRARDYDLRFRLIAPSGAVGEWQYPPTWQHTTLQHQALLNLSAGTTYCFSVRARDALNEVTDWTRPACTTRMYDDASLPRADGWTQTTNNPGFLDGTATTGQSNGAQLAVGGSFNQVALLLYRCPTCGVVDIYADTRLLTRLDLHGSRPAIVTWTSHHFSTARALTLRVVSDGKPVVVDGFGLAPPHQTQ